MNINAERLWAEIDLDTAESNLNLIKSKLPRGSEICCVVKANAYGHDDAALSHLYETLGVTHFAVSNIHEAQKIRRSRCNFAEGCTLCTENPALCEKRGIQGEILILGVTHPDFAEKLIELGITQTVTGFEHAKALNDSVKTGKLRIHIKVDTGMGRLGIKLNDFESAKNEIKAIAALPNLITDGVFTHFASADSPEDEAIDFTSAQKECFFYLVKQCEIEGVKFKYAHCLNSAGTIMYSDRRSNLCRVGISLYGLMPDVKMKQPFKLSPVMSLHSRVCEIKPLYAGETVSYGRTFTAQSDMVTAVIPVGYADGYPRSLSNKGYMLINGCKAYILGRVCMDQTVVDITNIPDVKINTPVTIIGKNGGISLTADDLAQISGTIGYEITCGIGLRVPRVIKRGGEVVAVSDYYSL
ncbi:MAG: alanine racemase [Ruminococcus sp.]|jgi:alanine racemase|nr:alanine racemase [Ruminococcus sp.]